MLQQAIPNCKRNSEDPRTQFIKASNFVKIKGEDPNASLSREFVLSSIEPYKSSNVGGMRECFEVDPLVRLIGCS
jgi:hypothetical protein